MDHGGCPHCGATLIDDGQHGAWCANCGHGTDTSGAAGAISWIELPGANAHVRANDRLLAAYREHPPDRATPTWRRAAVLTLASVIHVLGVATLVLAIARLVTGHIIDGVLVLAVVLWLCPWWRRFRWRDDLPAPVDIEPITAWVRATADRAGVRPPHVVHVQRNGLAETTITHQRRRHLTFGLLFFATLDPAAREAVLAHELAHWSTDDLTRGQWVGTAMSTVARPLGMAGMLPAQEPWDDGDAMLTGDPFSRLGLLVLRIVLLPLQPVLALFFMLSCEDHLAAEYRADRISALLTGSATCADMLLRISPAMQLRMGENLRGQVARRAASIDWPALAEGLHGVDQREQVRLAWRDRVAQLRRGRSHPPTIDRVRVLQRWPEPASETPDLEMHARIDAAVGPALTTWGRMLANIW